MQPTLETGIAISEKLNFFRYLKDQTPLNLNKTARQWKAEHPSKEHGEIFSEFINAYQHLMTYWIPSGPNVGQLTIDPLMTRFDRPDIQLRLSLMETRWFQMVKMNLAGDGSYARCVIRKINVLILDRFVKSVEQSGNMPVYTLSEALEILVIVIRSVFNENNIKLTGDSNEA